MLLNVLRTGSKTIFAKALFMTLLFAMVAGLALMDVGGFFRSGGTGSTSVARVGGEQLSAQAFDNIVRQILGQQGLEPGMAYQMGIIEQILNARISSSLIYKAAYDDGLNIGDEFMTKKVRALIDPYVSEQMSAKDALRRLLMSQGMSEAQFVDSYRMDIANNVMRAAFQGAAAFTPVAEARDIYMYQNEKRKVTALILPHDTIKDYQDPKDEVLLPFYQAGQERYAIPEARSFTMAVLTDDAVKKSFEISDEELKKIYEEQIDSFTLPEQRVLEQAVISDEKQAKDVAEKIKAGAALKDAVKEVTGKTDSYVGKETFAKAGLAEPIAAAAFAAGKGETPAPVQTALGWHVITVADIIPPKQKSFEDVKEGLRKDTLHTKLADQMFALSGEIDDRLAGGEDLEAIAKEMGLKTHNFGPVREDGSTPDQKEGITSFKDDRDTILEAAFTLAEGESSPVFELKDGSFAAVQIDKITEKTYKPFDEIKGGLRKVWIADQQQVLNKQRAQDILKKLGAGDTTLEQLAKDTGLKLQAMTLTRADDPPAPLTGPAKTKFFEAAKGDYDIVVLEDGLAVGQVLDVTFPDPAKISAKDLDDTIKTATRGSQDETFMSYLTYLQNKYRVNINHRLLQQMYGAGGEKS